MWIKVTYPCRGKTVRDTQCGMRLPYPGRFCWTHRDQNPNSPYYKGKENG